jgi:hypothetical protein
MRNAARQTRKNRTITVDFQNEATYFQLLGDGKAFVECVLAQIPLQSVGEAPCPPTVAESAFLGVKPCKANVRSPRPQASRARWKGSCLRLHPGFTQGAYPLPASTYRSGCEKPVGADLFTPRSRPCPPSAFLTDTAVSLL